MTRRSAAEVIAIRQYLATLPSAKGLAKPAPGNTGVQDRLHVTWGMHKLYSTEAIKLLARGVDSMRSDSRNAMEKHLKRATELGPWRKLALAPAPDSLASLKKRFPNFSEAIADVERSFALSALAPDRTLSIPPILLVGAPGIGKTRFVQALSQVIGTVFHEISFSTITAGWVLAGSDLSWADGRPGKIYMTLVEGEIANPAIMLDEIDKNVDGFRYDPYGPLYGLLEPVSAANFKDEAIPLPLDTRRILWFAAANELSNIPDPITSRFLVRRIAEPSEFETAAVIRSIYQDLVTTLPWGARFTDSLEDHVMSALIGQTPREVRRILIDAAGSAALSNRNFISVQDLRFVPSPRPMGFVD